MRLFIVRHGQTCPREYVGGDWDLPRADPPITELGHRQAVLTGEEMKRVNFAGRIISSPFTRTLTTAACIARSCGLPVHLDARFREIVKTRESMEGFAGKPLTQLREEFPCLARDAQLEPKWWREEAETYEDVCRRVEPLIRDVILRGEDCVLVGHGASTVAANSILMERARMRCVPEVFSAQGVNCSLSEYHIEGGKVRPIRMYSVSHIPLDMVTSNYRYALERME